MFRKLLFIGVAALLLVALVAPVQADESTKICLLDGRGPKTPDMKDCVYENESSFFSDDVFMENGGKLVSFETGVSNRAYFQPSYMRVQSWKDLDGVNDVWETPEYVFDSNRSIYNYVADTEVSPVGYAGIRNNAIIVAGQKSYMPVQAYGDCYYIDNFSGDDIFIPFRTEEEWRGFLNRGLSNVVFTKCVQPITGTLANKIYYGPTSANFTRVYRPDRGLNGISGSNVYFPKLPYSRPSTSWPTEAGKEAEFDKVRFYYICSNFTRRGRCTDPTSCGSRSCCRPMRWSNCREDHKWWYEEWQLTGIRTTEDGQWTGTANPATGAYSIKLPSSQSRPTCNVACQL